MRLTQMHILICRLVRHSCALDEMLYNRFGIVGACLSEI